MGGCEYSECGQSLQYLGWVDLQLFSEQVISDWRHSGERVVRYFSCAENPLVFDSFTECVEWAFACMRSGNEKYPDFFTMHSIGFIGEEKQSGQELMEKSWEHIKTGFFTVLMGDKRVNRAVFNEIFTPKRFVEIVFSLILSSLIQQDYDSAAIVKMIELILYR